MINLSHKANLTKNSSPERNFSIYGVQQYFTLTIWTVIKQSKKSKRSSDGETAGI